MTAIDFRPFRERLAEDLYTTMVEAMRMVSSRADWNLQSEHVRDCWKKVADRAEVEVRAEINRGADV